MNVRTAPSFPPLLAVFLAAAASVTLGAAVATNHLTIVALLVLAIAGVLATRWNYGIVAGLLLLLSLDGVPLVNTKPPSTSGTNVFDDLSFLGLAIVLTAAAIAQSRGQVRLRQARWAYAWAAGFFIWWAFLVTITVFYKGIPLVPAVAFGRQYLYYLLIFPVALTAFHQRKYIDSFLLTLAAGAALYSIGLIATSVTGAQLSWLIHATKTIDTTGIVRVYAPMNTLLIAVFPIAVAVAAAVTGPRRWRLPALGVTALTGIANALSLTRAVYISEIAGLVLVSLIWASRSGWHARRIRRILAAGAVLVTLGILVAGGASSSAPSSGSPVQAVADRALLGFTNLEQKSGSFGYRIVHAERSLGALGASWPVGLGFLEPKYHYVVGLREGSIQDSDLGSIVNLLMTMGIVGLLFAFAPVLVGLMLLLKRHEGWMDYGAAMYLTVTLIASVTLETVSGQSGVIIFGCMMAIAWNLPAASAAEEESASLARREAPMPWRRRSAPVELLPQLLGDGA
jgi:hypothetical protein